LFFGNFNLALGAPNKKAETPTRIRSDVIDIKRKSQIVDFLGNVVVEKDDSSLLAQKMRVIYEEKEEKTAKKITTENAEKKDETEKSDRTRKTEIKQIDATENVKIFSEEFVASGDIGYYKPKEDTFTLEKNVIVNNGTSIGSGDKFVYNLKTKKGNFIGKKNETSITGNGGDKRVVIVIGDDLQTERKTKKSKNKVTNEQNP
jgi:lipopolysaccharide export system protein LptA